MEVILLEDIQGLGYKDDIVKVKNGYGRNYLIPTKRAVIASESARKVLAEKLKQRAHKLEKIKQEAQVLADKLAKVPALVIATKVSPTGVIYGSVNSLQIADKLKEAGFDIDRKRIDVKGVKEIGEYAFKNTRITRAELTAVTKIGDHAFEDCKALTSVYISSAMQPSGIGQDIFSGCTSGLKFEIHETAKANGVTEELLKNGGNA